MRKNEDAKCKSTQTLGFILELNIIKITNLSPKN